MYNWPYRIRQAKFQKAVREAKTLIAPDPPAGPNLESPPPPPSPTAPVPTGDPQPKTDDLPSPQPDMEAPPAPIEEHRGLFDTTQQNATMRAIEWLASQLGYGDVEDFLIEKDGLEATWGICRSCDYASQTATPYQKDDSCPNCDQPTFTSVLVLAGLL
jgi:hypothetical protein